ncbi:MAG: 1-acyl-sn-glycerol-3-phosphate acyltransferase [Balneola sp.]|nr:MAG: 1-acyl-sn-glycerol-3-phosphate acyltransferase [Balneola sp.]
MRKIVLILIWCVLVKWFLRAIVGIKTKNSEALKKESQFVIIANHNSHLDTVSILSSIPPKRIHTVKPVAAGDYFGKTRFLGFLSNYFLNTLLISRKNIRSETSGNPIDKMIEELDKGNSLILFPEGTRGEPEVMSKFKRGIGVLLEKRPDIKYLPAYMKGMGKTLPKGERILVPFNSVLLFGEPKKAQHVNSKEIIQEIEQEILNLKDSFN